MKIEEFINKYNNKQIGNGQCTQVVLYYLNECMGYKAKSTDLGNATNIDNNFLLKNGFKKYATGQDGDIIIYEKGSNSVVSSKYGHCGLFYNKSLYDQNNSGHNEKRFGKASKIYANADYYRKETQTVQETPKEAPNQEVKETASLYYPKTSYNGSSIVDGLNSIKVNSSFSNRSKIAKANGIKLYIGTGSQNTLILNLLKSGKLKKA